MQPKTKLLFRNRSLEMGGTENVLLTMLNELDQSEYEITLLLNYFQGEFLNRVPAGIKVLSIGKGSQSFSANRVLNICQKMWRRLIYAWFQKFPNSFYRKYGLLDQNIEVAFSHYMYADILNSPNKKSKKIFWFHGDLRNSGLTFEQNKAVVDQMQQFDAGVFVSAFSKETIEKAWKTSLFHARVIHNPIPVTEVIRKAMVKPSTDYGDITFISVGRLFKQKGFMDFLQAHIRLIREGHLIRTLLVGDGIQRPELESCIRQNGVGDSFILAGYHENPFPYLKTAECFVLPSYSESYPLVIAESLVLNTPVLSTNVGGVDEILPEAKDCLQLFEPSAENVYQAMKEFLQIREKDSAAACIDSAILIKAKNRYIYSQIEELLSS